MNKYYLTDKMKLFLMCVCCVHVSMLVCMCVDMYVNVCGSLRLMLSVFLNYSSPFSLRHGLSSEPRTPQFSCLTSQLAGPHYLHISSTLTTGALSVFQLALRWGGPRKHSRF